MDKKQETTLPVDKIPGKAFTGEFTLNDIETLGVTDILVIVTDKQYQKHILTTPEPIKTEECAPGEGVQRTFNLVEKSIENGQPLPGKRNKPYELCPDKNCLWLVQSEKNQGGDWIEKIRICIAYPGVTPACPLMMIVAQ
ncbi:hypothetical protein [Nitrosovibrio sp. Nv4]|uniref:hypothetical protein n=1 Tax=Nitrosovibrio sp. Nv4 TaxID=1945880 RepID=UPI000BD3429F|nr:hypothetical protein [Nitrosovibrio sp. Nv4]SOD42525.1 hypothetical protein SAMN06298226_2871 [Nitrosovibrio sp. Nv4]